MLTRTANATALVTGASSGIGRELADVIAADGHDVILTARREERLRDVATELETDHGVDTEVFPQDLAEPTAASDLYEAVQDAGIDVDVLINNAGVPVYGDFHETDLEAEQNVMQVNMVTLTELTKLFLPGLVDHNEGIILNMASLASLYPLPRKAVYTGTKAYVLSFSRALAHELADEGVTVTAVCPGVVETEYADRGNVDASNTMEGVTNDPRSVAEAGWEGAKDGDRIVFPSTFASYGSQLIRLLPRKQATKIGESTVEDGASWL